MDARATSNGRRNAAPVQGPAVSLRGVGGKGVLVRCGTRGCSSPGWRGRRGPRARP
jgi:hypothetical protein